MADVFKNYHVSAADREPLIDFMIGALESQGCRVLHRPDASIAPFRITFETPQGERFGVVAYAFLANNKPIKNRPLDEHRFQIKYGSDLSGLHSLWQDPFGLYVTLLVGINPEKGFFVAADPNLHNPTRFSVSVEFKDHHVADICKLGWHAWERERRGGVPHAKKKRSRRANVELGEPLFEVLVGGSADRFLQLIRFEREALLEAPGERHYIADHIARGTLLSGHGPLAAPVPPISAQRLHALALEFELPESKVLDLIAERRMLKIAVRGSVAEEHLIKRLTAVAGVTGCERLADDRGPDVLVSFKGKQLRIECKNTSRVRTKDGLEKIDFQRTRAAKANPCSRYYKRSEFDVVAACLHAVTEKWDFKYAPVDELDGHPSCAGRMSNNVKLDQRWTSDPTVALDRVLSRR